MYIEVVASSDDKVDFMTTLVFKSYTILCMRPASERRRYAVTPSLIGWVHTQNEPRNVHCLPKANYVMS